jgi:hypothetical protein
MIRIGRCEACESGSTRRCDHEQCGRDMKWIYVENKSRYYLIPLQGMDVIVEGSRLLLRRSSMQLDDVSTFVMARRTNRRGWRYH